MTPILILVLWLSTETGPAIETQQISFPTIEACEAAAHDLERDLAGLNAKAVCLNRHNDPAP